MLRLSLFCLFGERLIHTAAFRFHHARRQVGIIGQHSLYSSAGASIVDESPPYIVNYSERCIAIFGNTKPLKESLRSIGGKYNQYLRIDPGKKGIEGNRKPGWVFPVKSKEIVENLLRERSVDPPDPKICDPALTECDPFIENYSGKTIAVFGNTRPLKEYFKEIGGKFNRYLKHGGITRPGWTFSVKLRESVITIISGNFEPEHLGRTKNKIIDTVPDF